MEIKFLNNPWVIEELNFLTEWNMNTIYQNLWVESKVILRGKCIAFNGLSKEMYQSII